MSKFLIILFLFFFLNTGSGVAFFNKKEFKFERCYTEDYLDHDTCVKEGVFLYWEWEINLRKKTATRISAFKDDEKVSLKTFPIITVTSQYIQTAEVDGVSYIFERKTGKIQITTQENKLEKPSIMTCEKYESGFFKIRMKGILSSN